MKGILRAFMVVNVLSATACMEQYNPQPFWQKLSNEREISQREQPQLTAQGTLPPTMGLAGGAGASKAAAFDPAKAFATYCVACHGPQGNAKINNARDLTDAKWQAEATDEQIRTVIELGALEASKKVDFSKRSPEFKVGNPLMTPWGSVIVVPGSNDEEKKQQLEAMVGFVRTLKK